MTQSIDILASAIHDAKNQIFFAGNLMTAVAEEHGIDLGAIREAMERASSRLTRALMAYRLDSAAQPLSISAVAVHGLLEDAASMCHARFADRGLSLDIHCDVEDVWLLDRDLVLDVINNGVENATRFAAANIGLSALCEENILVLRIEDDGPGYGNAAAPDADHGLGLYIGGQIARLHHRHGASGELRQYNGGRWGGAVLELRLP